MTAPPATNPGPTSTPPPAGSLPAYGADLRPVASSAPAGPLNPPPAAPATSPVSPTTNAAAGSGGAAVPVEFDFGTVNDKAVVLNSASECLYLNLNGAAMPAGTVLNVFVEWSEE